MRFRRHALTDLNRPRVGLSEADVQLERRRSLRGRVLVMASGATAFNQSKSARAEQTAGRMTQGEKTP